MTYNVGLGLDIVFGRSFLLHFVHKDTHTSKTSLFDDYSLVARGDNFTFGVDYFHTPVLACIFELWGWQFEFLWPDLLLVASYFVIEISHDHVGLFFWDGVYFALKHVVEFLYDIFVVTIVWHKNLKYRYGTFYRVEGGAK